MSAQPDYSIPYSQVEPLLKLASSVIDMLKEFQNDIGGCDHSVGICQCELDSMIVQLQEAHALSEGRGQSCSGCAKVFVPDFRWTEGCPPKSYRPDLCGMCAEREYLLEDEEYAQRTLDDALEDILRDR